MKVRARDKDRAYPYKTSEIGVIGETQEFEKTRNVAVEEGAFLSSRVFVVERLLMHEDLKVE
jgi:hypothetical protein